MNLRIKNQSQLSRVFVPTEISGILSSTALAGVRTRRGGEFHVMWAFLFAFFWSSTRVINCFYIKNKALSPEIKTSGSLLSCWDVAPPTPLLAHLPAPSPKECRTCPTAGNIYSLLPGSAEMRGQWLWRRTLGCVLEEWMIKPITRTSEFAQRKYL